MTGRRPQGKNVVFAAPRVVARIGAGGAKMLLRLLTGRWRRVRYVRVVRAVFKRSTARPAQFRPRKGWRIHGWIPIQAANAR